MSQLITMIKTPLGTRDFGPEEALVRERLLDCIRDVFKKYGGKPLETPTFERREYLMKKYGDDTKLIYDLKTEQGDCDREANNEDNAPEMLSLRYDLTIPLARYLAQNNLVKLRRYQIAKVFRRDQPNVTKARLREFYQCDFDIIGEPETMIPEIQLLKIGQEILQKFGINFKIKFNFRNNLIEILQLSGVPTDLYLTTCSSLDKLDKKSWDEIKEELVTKQLTLEQVNQIKEKLDSQYLSTTVRPLYEKFCNFAKIMGLDQYLQYDLCLARGMDYYTGLIFEFVIPEMPEIGTVMAGGRYDNLTQMFKESLQTPAIGLSVGFERIYFYLSQKSSKMISESNLPIVYLASITKDTQSEQVAVLTQYKLQLYNALLTGFPRCQIILDADETPPLSKQINTALEANADYLVFIGNRELSEKTVTVKDLKLRKQQTVNYDEFLALMSRSLETFNQELTNSKLTNSK